MHPVPRQLEEGDYSRPSRVSGSSGTGKTIVAFHREVCLQNQIRMLVFYFQHFRLS